MGSLIKLYVKTHTDGLNYFGKTIEKDVESYPGSGKYWKRYLKKHGKNVDTKLFFESTNQRLVTAMAVGFSIANDIVKSKDWANLIMENGLDGSPGGLVVVKDINGNSFQTSVTDPRYLSGELVHVLKGIKKSPESVKKQSNSLKKWHEINENPNSASGEDSKIYNTITIHKGEKEINVKPNELWYMICDGWKRGKHPDSIKSMQVKKTFKDGSRQSCIKDIEVYDSDNVLRYTVKDSFIKFCKENDLPFNTFADSYKTNKKISKKFNKTKKDPNRSRYNKYNGWSARVKED